MTVGALIERLLFEFPEWSNEEAWLAATRIVGLTDQMTFQLEVERTLDALPITTEAA